MSTKINIAPMLLRYTNNQQMAEVNGSTVGQCLDHLIEQFPDIKQGLYDEDGNLNTNIEIFINRESAYPDELAKPVQEGDELYLVFALSGG